jgi:UDP-N-acetylmuramoylalanine--D-glutamate ligase
MGLARSGAGAANLLQSLGAAVTVTDSKTEESLKTYSDTLTAGIRKVLGSHPDELFTKTDLIVVSPGVPLTVKPLAKAREAGVEIMGELELAFLVSNSPFIAITGTNGKSTTTSLTGEMLIASGMKAFVGGNLGNALTEEPERLKGQDFVVAEVSSFQLEAINEFRPRISAVLNITQDHLDRYADMAGYTEAKAAVFRNQKDGDVLVLNADDPPTAALKDRAACRVVWFSRKNVVEDGVYLKDGMVMAASAGNATGVIPADGVRIKGAHNLENAMAAAAISLSAGVTPEVIAKVLREFPGLEHRMEFVRELDGVTYINDSKGTNVGAVEKSLESFNQPVILIAGGLDKHSDFTPLAPIVKERVKKLILIGKAADVMNDALGAQTDTVRAATLADAVKLSRDSASPGDVVLLSPACASFDMFKDFEDRGRQFKALVNSLA